MWKAAPGALVVVAALIWPAPARPRSSHPMSCFSIAASRRQRNCAGWYTQPVVRWSGIWNNGDYRESGGSC